MNAQNFPLKTFRWPFLIEYNGRVYREVVTHTNWEGAFMQMMNSGKIPLVDDNPYNVLPVKAA